MTTRFVLSPTERRKSRETDAAGMEALVDAARSEAEKEAEEEREGEEDALAEGEARALVGELEGMLASREVLEGDDKLRLVGDELEEEKMERDRVESLEREEEDERGVDDLRERFDCCFCRSEWWWC